MDAETPKWVLAHRNASKTPAKCFLAMGYYYLYFLVFTKYIIVLLPLILFACIVDTEALVVALEHINSQQLNFSPSYIGFLK